jgi:protein-tyrosine kinase
MERIQAAIQKAKEQRSGAARAEEPPRGPAAYRQPMPPAPLRGPEAVMASLAESWGELPAFEPDPGRMRRERIVSFARTDPIHLTFDMLRTKILRQMRENGWTSLAITSPTTACGKTVVALNLAFSFAQQKDRRTVLMDLDLRRPAVGRALGLQEVAPQSLERFLQGEADSLGAAFVRCGEGLAIAPAATSARNPAELLSHPAARAELERMKAALRPEAILYDLPPILICDDVLAFLPNVDCVLIVAGAEISTLDEIDRCERELSEQTNVLGVILNKCRYVPDPYGYDY